MRYIAIIQITKIVTDCENGYHSLEILWIICYIYRAYIEGHYNNLFLSTCIIYLYNRVRVVNGRGQVGWHPFIEKYHIPLFRKAYYPSNRPL